MKYMLTLSFLITVAFAQFPNVMIDSNAGGYMPCEPSIAVSLKDTSVLVAGAVLDFVYLSDDGGRSWDKQILSSPMGVLGDPCIIPTSDGSFYYLHLSNPGVPRGKRGDGVLDQIVCQRSDDNGKTWNDGAGMGKNSPKSQDKEWAVEDPRTGRMYASWTQFDKYDSPNPKDKSNIMISWSDDRGESWSKALRINQKSGDCRDDDKTTEGAVPAVGPDGEVYVAWAWKNKIWFDRSMDGGRTWKMKDKKVAKQPGGWNQDVPGLYRCNGMPITVCDLSDGPNRGDIYICWSDHRNGKGNIDIWLSSSSDHGNHWTSPVRVNNDEGKAMQFFPWLTIDQTTGYLYCVFYDQRDASSLETEVYVAFSTDGGKTFSNVKISEKSFSPKANVFFGDYNNISAHNGKIAPIWTSMNSRGKNSVWTAIISHKALEMNND